MKHTHHFRGQTITHDHGLGEVHPNLTWEQHGYFGHNTDHVDTDSWPPSPGSWEPAPHPELARTLDGFLETYAPGKAHITLGPMGDDDTRQVVNINLDDYPKDRLTPFIVVRCGKYAVVLTTMNGLDHISVDSHGFVDGQEATVGAFGLSREKGRQVLDDSAGTTSYGWNSAGMVTLLIGEQG